MNGRFKLFQFAELLIICNYVQIMSLIKFDLLFIENLKVLFNIKFKQILLNFINILDLDEVLDYILHKEYESIFLLENLA